MSTQARNDTKTSPILEPPWYKQFWPWFIIALPASAVIASLFTLWLAVSRPDQVVLDDEEYQRLNNELKAQAPAKKDESDRRSN